MDEQKLYDALDGLFAYDSGCVSSGIKDETLRKKIKTHLHEMSEEEQSKTLSRFIRHMFLEEEQLEKGYGIEDVKKFIEWLSEQMDFDL